MIVQQSPQCKVNHPLVRVEWVDAITESGWVEQPKPSDDLTVCYGLLVDKGVDWVTLAMCHVPGKPDYWGTVWNIPSGMVRRIKVIDRNPICEVKKKPRRSGAVSKVGRGSKPR